MTARRKCLDEFEDWVGLHYKNPGSGFDYPGFAFTSFKSESWLEDEPGFFHAPGFIRRIPDRLLSTFAFVARKTNPGSSKPDPGFWKAPYFPSASSLSAAISFSVSSRSWMSFRPATVA